MLETIKSIARQAGAIVLSADASGVREKGSRRNLVTQYDVQVQEFIRCALFAAYPTVHFIGEENNAQDDALHGLAFIVDPIDGTANFVRGYRASAICIAAVQDGVTVYGVVYDPYTNSLFSAQKDHGAWLNDQPIHVSDMPLAESIICLGTASYYADTFDHTFRLARALFDAAMDLRRSGSAALDLCYVACGRADLMFEARLCPWDHAAAGLIVTEAGGRISQFSGASASLTEKCSILAANPRAWQEFFDRGFDVL